MKIRTACAAGLLVMATASAWGLEMVPQTRKDGDSFMAKLDRLAAQGDRCPCETRTRTVLTEREVNGYLIYHAPDQLPEGVVDPRVTIVGSGRLSGRVTVDLDRVRTSRKRGWLDPVGYLTGRLPVTATGLLHTRAGVAKFELENATVGGASVPKAVLQELVAFYTADADNPAGLSLDDTFELPASIREIQIGKGEAYVIQ